MALENVDGPFLAALLQRTPRVEMVAAVAIAIGIVANWESQLAIVLLILLALVFGVGFSMLALLTRRWVLAWFALAGSGLASAIGMLAVWSRQTATHGHPGPGIGLVIGSIAIAVLYLIIRATKRTWWLWGTGATLVFVAILAMLAVILLTDQLVFRPLVAWADRFKFEFTESQDTPQSWFLELLRRTQLLRMLMTLPAWLWQRLRPVALVRQAFRLPLPRLSLCSSEPSTT